MDERAATPEALPPLELRKLRDLEVSRPSDDEREGYLSAASAVVRRGDFIYVPSDPGERKHDKPDLEALSALPPFEGAPYGGLLGLGSRSGPATAASSGSSRRMARSTATRARSTWRRSTRCCVRSYDLGEMDGTRLCFSDATPLSDELIVFTASAEVDDDSKADGAIRGSVVGTIGGDGSVERPRTIDRKWKVEGVHAAVDTGVIDLVFVCDQDADEPSPLLSATMPADAALEGEPG